MPNNYPPVKPGTSVKTTEPNMEMREDWTLTAWEKRKWGVQGTVIVHHDSHGLCYDIMHEDGSVGTYDPSEFEIMP